jgi:prevent-host-death family protein
MTHLQAQDILPATTVKRRFLELLKQLGPEHRVIGITRNGVPAGVLMSMEQYESVLETLEILAAPKLRRAMDRARGDFARRKTLSHDQVWQDE